LDFKHFSVDQGMSSSSVGSIYQDRTGYMWFGNSNGIDRYDGYNFTSYKYPRESSALVNRFPGTISEDAEGNIWFPSYNGGLEKLNTVKGDHAHLYVSDSEKIPLTDKEKKLLDIDGVKSITFS